MHIIVILLKILGFLILFLLGLLLLVLINPICYRFELVRDGMQPTYARGRIRWFIWGLIYDVSYINQIYEYKLRFFGIQVMGNQPEFLAKKEEKEKRKEEKERKKREKGEGDKAEGDRKDKAKDKEGEEDDQAELSIAEYKDSSEDESTDHLKDRQEAHEKAMEVPLKEEENKTDQEKKDDKNTIEEFLANFINRNLDRLMKRIDKMKSLSDSLKMSKKAYDKLGGEMLVRKLWTAVRKVKRHIFPRKLSGYLRFGLWDPALTGTITGAFATMYPLYGGHFTVEPDFVEECFYSDCKGSGRIYPIYIIYIIIWLLLDKNVRRAIRYYRRKSKSR